MAALACAAAFANPTSLNVIPTAEVLPNGNANFAVQLTGGRTPSGYTFLNQFQTELGLGDNIEFGYDQALPPTGPSLWNAKYRIYEETRRRPALAVGLLTNAGVFNNPVYVTAFKSDGDARLHVGAIEAGNSLRAMLGFDLWHGAPLAFQADYISGSGTYISFGVVYSCANGLSLTAAQLVGNTASTPNAYLVILSWSGKVL